ncbi:MAG TPA: DNA topoisomerase [Gammaproteobacteria bacterium]|nr:DNA topoisomerase [Gammaproteobacteria bacterium]
MQLMIVDSYRKKKALQAYCGFDWRIVVCAGQICDLPTYSLGIAEPDFKPRYELLENATPFMKSLNQLAATADHVWLAMESNREGEILARHLAQHLIADSIKRIVFIDITKDGMTTALNNPRKIDQQLCDAWTARRVIDRLIGYKVSEQLTQMFQKPVAVGRVQSIALKLIVKRERVLRAFMGKNPTYLNNEPLLASEEQLRTNTLKRFDELSLIAALEQESVGCSRTLIPILNILEHYNYVVKQNAFLHPTPFAEKLIDLLEGKFKFLDLSYTRDLEIALHDISVGKQTYFSIVNKVNDDLQKGLGLLRDMSSVSALCPRCQAPIKRLRDEYGYFMACSRYQEGCTGSPSDTPPLECA